MEFLFFLREHLCSREASSGNEPTAVAEGSEPDTGAGTGPHLPILTE